MLLKIRSSYGILGISNKFRVSHGHARKIKLHMSIVLVFGNLLYYVSAHDKNSIVAGASGVN